MKGRGGKERESSRRLRLRQEEHCEFKTNLGYIMSSRLAWGTRQDLSHKTKTREERGERQLRVRLKAPQPARTLGTGAQTHTNN